MSSRRVQVLLLRRQSSTLMIEYVIKESTSAWGAYVIKESTSAAPQAQQKSLTWHILVVLPRSSSTTTPSLLHTLYEPVKPAPPYS